MRIISATPTNQQQQPLSSSSSPTATTVVNSRRPVCAAEVYVLADALRKSRTVEFSLPSSLAVSEVRLLHYLRDHGDFIRRQGDNDNNNKEDSSSSSSSTKIAAERAAAKITDVVNAIRDLCSVPCSPQVGPAAVGASSPGNTTGPVSQCVLTEDELIQLVNLRVLTEVDLYKVIPDIDSRLGGESKIPPMLSLLQQLK